MNWPPLSRVRYIACRIKCTPFCGTNLVTHPTWKPKICEILLDSLSTPFRAYFHAPPNSHREQARQQQVRYVQSQYQAWPSTLLTCLPRLRENRRACGLIRFAKQQILTCFHYTSNMYLTPFPSFRRITSGLPTSSPWHPSPKLSRNFCLLTAFPFKLSALYWYSIRESVAGFHASSSMPFKIPKNFWEWTPRVPCKPFPPCA